VTLARLRDTSSRQVADFLSIRQPFRSPPFSVSRFVLYSSRPLSAAVPMCWRRDIPLSREGVCYVRESGRECAKMSQSSRVVKRRLLFLACLVTATSPLLPANSLFASETQ